MSIASLEALILDALADAPPGSNPFRIIETALLFSQEGTYPPSYKYQLWVLSGALALIVVLIAVGAGIDALRGRLWVVTIRSGYIIPHWEFSWSAYAIILFSLLQGLIWITLQALEGARSWDLTLWKTVVWTPACLCGLTLIWVLGVNYLLSVKSTGIEITSIFARPAVVNSVALLLPIFYIGSVVGSCTAVAVSYDKVLDILDEVYAELDAAAAAWEGAPLSLAAMGPELVALARIQAPDALFMWRMRWFLGSHSPGGSSYFLPCRGLPTSNSVSFRKSSAIGPVPSIHLVATTTSWRGERKVACCSGHFGV